MVTLTNDFLTVEISETGAQLTSVKDNNTGIEYLWQGDNNVWPRQAPVLFPIVGALKNDQYTYRGETYHMTQHGFARDRVFTVAQASAAAAEFTLHDDEATHAQYPFAFKFTITIALDNNQIRITYKVENPADKSPLYFSVGGHPGFRLPLTEDTTYNDYYLAFTPKKSRVTIPLVAGQGIDYDNRTLAATDVNQQLSHDYFKNDAVIFELNGRTKLAVKSDRTKHGVEVTSADAPFIGVWSQYPTEGNFVCLEPWWGIADPLDATGDITQKLGINELMPGQVFEHGYQIAIF